MAASRFRPSTTNCRLGCQPDKHGLIVIEAKFFGMMPSADELADQIRLQQQVIRFIGEKYPSTSRYSQIYLGPRYLGPPSSPPDASTIGRHACITWHEILVYAEAPVGEDDYVVARLRNALCRWEPQKGQSRQKVSEETKARPVIKALIEKFGRNDIQVSRTDRGKLTLDTINLASFSIRVFSLHANTGVSLLHTTASAIVNGLVYLPTVDYLEKYFVDRTDRALLDDYSAFLKELAVRPKSLYNNNRYQISEKQLQDRKEQFAELAKRFAGRTNRD